MESRLVLFLKQGFPRNTAAQRPLVVGVPPEPGI